MFIVQPPRKDAFQTLIFSNAGLRLASELHPSVLQPLDDALVADASASDTGTASYRQETTAVSSLAVGMDFNTELWVIMSYLDKGS